MDAKEGKATALYCVKWKTPTDELARVSACVERLARLGDAPPHKIAIAVPNLNWAVQARRALGQARMRGANCFPIRALRRDDAEAMAALDMLASPQNAKARDKWCSFGHAADEASAFLAEHANAKGATLLRATGIRGRAVFEQALLHAEGDETPAQMSEILHGQLQSPTLPPEPEVCPIVELGSPLLDDGFSWVFAIALVDGIIPGEGAPQSTCEHALTALGRTLGAASVGSVASWFGKADHALAEQAKIRIMRVRVEHGKKFALCSHTPLLSKLSTPRQPTMSGTEFCREVARIANGGAGGAGEGDEAGAASTTSTVSTASTTTEDID